MPNSIDDPWLHIERAKEHLQDLDAKISEFVEANPFRVTAYEDVHNATYIMRLRIPIIDLKLAVIAGESIYNLRVALDHIAWQLALTNKDRPHDRTAFPVVDENTVDKMRRFDRITRDIPGAAVDVIRTLQPYHRGSDFTESPLWKLDKLCNIGKHRVIPAQGTALEFKIPKNVDTSLISLNALKDEYIVTMPLSVKTQMQRAPLPAADIVFGSRVDGITINAEGLAKLYDFVRDEVYPTFTGFFHSDRGST
ncbi:MAG: hypothetical protein H8E48_04595 [Chloroflexi bacterium]|nr:hypothetical protein [Chloroflexota bacterium]